MKKIKDFIYKNKKNILIFIMLIVINIGLAYCKIPKAKAQTGITELNDIWGKSWKINETISWPNSSTFDIQLKSNLTETLQEPYVIGNLIYNNDTTQNIRVNIAYSTGISIPVIGVNRNTSTSVSYLEFTYSAVGGRYRISSEVSNATDGRIYTTNSLPLTINFNEYNGDFDFSAITSTDYDLDYYISWWNNNFTEQIPPTNTNNLNIYVNDQLAYNDSIEFIDTAVSPSIQYVYSNYTINQMGFGNLAKPLKYTANEFIANVFNFENYNNAFIDFAFTGSYLVGLSYDYTNLSGEQISNSFTFEPDEEESFRLISLTNLQRNDTDINIRITTNNLNDFESGAVNSAFKTIFGFFNEIINIQFGFITIGQILGFILAIAIIGLIYKVWNGGNND